MMEGVRIQETGTDLGRITVATKNFSKGSIVFQERPLVAIQSVFNKSQTLVCSNCHRFVGDLNLQANLLTKVVSRVDIMNSGDSQDKVTVEDGNEVADSGKNTMDTLSVPAPTLSENESFASFSSYASCPCVLCPLGCGEIYCSQACVAENKRRGHDLLCTGPHASDHPIVQFKTHAVSTNEIFLFAAVVAVEYISRYKVFKDVEKAWSPFSKFVQLPWWEIVHAPPDAVSQEGFSNTLKTIASESLKLFHSALSAQLINGKEKDETIDWTSCLDFLTLDVWGRIVGMFEQNQIGIRVGSPLGNVARQMSKEVSEGKVEEDIVEVLLDLADRVDEADCGDDDNDDCDDAFACMPCEPVDSGGVKPDFSESLTNDNESVSGGDEGNDYQEGIARMQLVAHMADEYFPPLDGTALFTVGCSINHSCSPNVSPVWCPDADQPIVLNFVALKDIKQGEELNFSYIDATLESVEERRLMLKDYGFVCECSRCGSV
jgi:hypothetical protein